MTQRTRQERTKVVATLGPSSADRGTLGQMIDAGLDVVRLNFSHGTREQHLANIRMVREVAAEHGGEVAILADLQGPKIRVGVVPDEGIRLVTGGTCELVAGVQHADPPAIPVVYEQLAQDVRPGNRILLDDGALDLSVVSVNGNRVRCQVHQGGVVRSRKGVNLPGVAVSAPSLTEKDVADLAIAVEGKVDYMALSFVRRPQDVIQARQAIRALGASIPVVAKLERPEVLDDLDAIVQASDGVMVARGDLGVEVAVERVPAIQKRIIARANALGVPVITATQMLESMITSARPTRAEASDVANAVFDGTDAVMLSGETAVGAHPVAAVHAMGQIIHEAEKNPELLVPPPPPRASEDGLGVAAAVCRAAVDAADDLGAEAIVALTYTGATARLVSRFRPRTPIVGITPNEETRRRMALYWGVEAAPRLEPQDNLTALRVQADQRLLAGGWAKHGDLVVVVAGTVGTDTSTNRMIVHRVGEASTPQDI